MITNTLENNQLSTSNNQIFKSINAISIIEVANQMITSGEVKTSLDFVNKFMFSLDSDKPFPINIDLLIEMGVYNLVGNAKKALQKYFTDGTDYQVQSFACFGKQAKNENRGGHNKQIIMLTVECFKSICMIPNNEAGKQTRLYYTDIEKIFKKYIIMQMNNKLSLERQEKEQLCLTLNNINKEKEELQSSLKNLRKNHNNLLKKRGYHKFKQGNCLYVLSNKKVGFTKDMDDRLRSDRTMVPTVLVKYLVYLEDAYFLEQMMLKKFRNNLVVVNHEVLDININIEAIIKVVKSLLKYFKFEHTEDEENINIYNYEIEETIMESKDFVEGDLESKESESDEEKEESEDEEKNESEDEEKEESEDEEKSEEDEEESEDEEKSESEDESEVEEKIEVVVKKNNNSKKIKQTEEELEDMTVVELRKLAKDNGLIQPGRKVELIKRIMDFKNNKVVDPHKNCKKIYQYGKDGKLIREFSSVKKASEIMGISEDMISNTLNKKSKTAKGFIWTEELKTFTSEELNMINKQSMAVEVIQVLKNGTEVKYKSITEASSMTGLSTGQIERRCKLGVEFKYGNTENLKRNLTDRQKKDIIRKYKSGTTMRELSEEYGKSVKQLRRVVNE